MSSWASALYVGQVGHMRLAPRRHAFRYGLFMALLDLDELDALDVGLRLFSRNKANLVSFHDADHLEPGRPLRAQIDDHLRDAGICAGGAIRILCLPRIFGYAFNPLSVFFCYDVDDGLAAILYEVNNTFGQRHAYLLPVATADAAAGTVHQSCAKAFYVSPFMDMDLHYRFKIVRPAETTHVGVDAYDGDRPMIRTHFGGRRIPLTDAGLIRMLARFPLASVKVVVGIHWEALCIWLKGIAFRPRPSAPASPITMQPRNNAVEIKGV